MCPLIILCTVATVACRMEICLASAFLACLTDVSVQLSARSSYKDVSSLCFARLLYCHVSFLVYGHSLYFAFYWSCSLVSFTEECSSFDLILHVSTNAKLRLNVYITPQKEKTDVRLIVAGVSLTCKIDCSALIVTVSLPPEYSSLSQIK